MVIERCRRWLGTPVDAASVAAFRIAFGLVMLASAVRFVAKGWVHDMFVAPSFHFSYPGFAWLSPWPEPWLYAHFVLMALAAAGVALGYRYRTSAVSLFVTFTSAELFDQAYYLNHYYLASLVAALCCVLPLQRAWSLDTWLARRRAPAPSAEAAIEATVPRAVPLVLRAQLAIVYGFAGIAKLDADWLLRGEPLRTWLQVHAELPVVGPWLQLPGVAVALSWGGVLFDLGIVFALCVRRTRRYAYLAVIAFHAATGVLFPIGVFPWLMVALTPVFFACDWPRRVLHALGAGGFRPAPTTEADRSLATLPTIALAAYLVVQLLLPLRHVLYAGPVNWSEEGFRFAWRVMLIEKTGHVELRAVDRERGEVVRIDPRAELTDRQYAQMATQPAMITAYAEHVAERFAAQGREVAVYADAWASLNGRPAQRLIDPAVNLARPRAPFAADPVIALR